MINYKLCTVILDGFTPLVQSKNKGVSKFI